MVAAAAAIAVLYPHMNGLGGDAFWLIEEPNGDSVAINACGRAADAATSAWYRDQGYARIPQRGPAAANTAPGAVAGWLAALERSRQVGEGRLPLSRLLAPAEELAREGSPVASALGRGLMHYGEDLRRQPGFAGTFLPNGQPPAIGDTFQQPALADVLDYLSRRGLSAFYQGDVADSMARELTECGSPVGRADLGRCAATEVAPLTLQLPWGRLRNLPPPTQGLASLLIVGLYERYGEVLPHAIESPDYVHALVEATKRAFGVRDRAVADPDHTPERPERWLDPTALDELAADFEPQRAMPWPSPDAAGDTVWLGAIDAHGRRISFIQSVFHEFGSGVVLPETGILWQNRGSSFDLEPASIHALAPGRQPFHTLNPAQAELADGRGVVYGTMGGHGQPQTQAAILTRLALGGVDAATALQRPRWLLGRAWGDGAESLKIEEGMAEGLPAELARRGHDVETVSYPNSLMGHAGMLVVDQDGIDAASDPRSDGGVDGVC